MERMASLKFGHLSVPILQLFLDTDKLHQKITRDAILKPVASGEFSPFVDHTS
jgi:hypothetical protein